MNKNTQKIAGLIFVLALAVSWFTGTGGAQVTCIGSGCGTGSSSSSSSSSSGGGYLTELQVTRISSTVIRVSRGKDSRLGGQTWTTPSYDCTLTGGTATGPWTAFKARNGTGVMLFPTGTTGACAVTAGDALSVPLGEQQWFFAATDPGTSVVLLASGTLTSGAVDTTVVDERPRVAGSSILSGFGTVVTTAVGEATVAVDAAVVCDKTGACITTGSIDNSAATSTIPFQVVSGAPSTNCSAAGDVGRVRTRSDVVSSGAGAYVCTQTGSGTYAYVQTGGSSGFSVTAAGQFLNFPMQSPVVTNLFEDFGPTLADPYYAAGLMQTGGTISNVTIFFQGSTDGGPDGYAVGIYDSSCNLLRQGNLTISGAASGTYTFPLSSALTMAPGWYYLGLVSEHTGITLREAYYGSNVLITRYNATTPQYFNGADNATGTGGSIVMPASCGTRTARATSGTVFAILEP